MKLIRFRRLNKTHWEIAFNEDNLFEKLDGDMAEIIMPDKPLIVRLWRKLFPLIPLTDKGNSGIIRSIGKDGI